METIANTKVNCPQCQSDMVTRIGYLKNYCQECQFNFEGDTRYSLMDVFNNLNEISLDDEKVQKLLANGSKNFLQFNELNAKRKNKYSVFHFLLSVSISTAIFVGFIQLFN
ncbi:hypothetical protein [Thorsellia kenyensis]|uniref:Uncharacterized protein n=1 Tax=Thorsellia kenyensis TaxID=1549888 RepID=A0ABV6C9U6_9GAMM